jgi:hypothetical protein
MRKAGGMGLLRTVGLAAVLCGALAPMAGAAQAAPKADAKQSGKDEVTQTDGTTQTGDIVSENYDGLNLEVKKGASRKIEWTKVASVKYANQPKPYVEAMDARSRAPADALTQLKELVGDAELRDVFKQNVLHAIPVLEQQLGDLKAAATDYDALIKAFPEGRYVGHAARGLVDVQLALGDPAAAGKAVDALAKDTQAANKLPASFQSLLTFLRARILRANGKFVDAQQAFESLLKAADLPADISGAAKLGIAECLNGQGKQADAEARFREIIAAPGPTFVLAGAWNGLADLLLKQGKDKRDADLMLQALYGYLRGVVQYVPGEAEPKDEYERSIAGAADSFRYLSDLETDKDRKASFAKRAAEKLDELRKLFPQSKYLPK